MAWTAPRTWVTAEVVTAAQMNAHVRDNLLETAPAKASAADQIFWSTAANVIQARTWPIAHGRARDTTIHTFSPGAETHTVSATVPIPTDWTTYDAVVEATFDILSTSASNRSFTITPEFDGTPVAGQAWSILAAAGNVVTFSECPSVTGYFEGLSATGSRTASVDITINVADTLVSTDDVALIATAFRVT